MRAARLDGVNEGPRRPCSSPPAVRPTQGFDAALEFPYGGLGALPLRFGFCVLGVGLGFLRQPLRLAQALGAVILPGFLRRIARAVELLARGAQLLRGII